MNASKSAAALPLPLPTSAPRFPPSIFLPLKTNWKARFSGGSAATGLPGSVGNSMFLCYSKCSGCLFCVNEKTVSDRKRLPKEYGSCQCDCAWRARKYGEKRACLVGDVILAYVADAQT